MILQTAALLAAIGSDLQGSCDLRHDFATRFHRDGEICVSKAQRATSVGGSNMAQSRVREFSQ